MKKETRDILGAVATNAAQLLVTGPIEGPIAFGIAIKASIDEKRQADKEGRDYNSENAANAAYEKVDWFPSIALGRLIRGGD